MKERNCNYRNCNCSIEHRSTLALYCSVQCKSNEKKYRQREQERFDKDREDKKRMIEEYKTIQEMSPESKNLWKLIYGN